MKIKIMKMMFKIIVFCGILCCFQACTDLEVISEIQKNQKGFQKWKGDVKMPIGYINYQSEEIVKQLVKGTLLKEKTDANGFYTFQYTKKLNPTKQNFTIPTPKTFKQDIQWPMNIQNTINSVGRAYIVKTGDGIEGDRIYTTSFLEDLKFSKKFSKAFFSVGELVLDFTLSAESDVSIEFTMYSLKNKTTGKVYKNTIHLTKSAKQKQLRIPLKDYELNLTHNGTKYDYGNFYNTFSVQLKTTYKFRAGDLLESSNTITYEVSFDNFRPDLVHGDFENEKFKVSKTTTVKLFESETGSVTFKNPKLIVRYTNKYGADIGVELSGIQGVKNENKTFLQYTKNKNRLIFEKATHTGTTLTPKTQEIVVDKTNSNFDKLIANAKEINLNLYGILNPNAQKGIPNDNFFDPSESELQAEMIVEMPLELTLKDFEKENTFSLSENIKKQLAHIKEFDLVFYINNGMPIEGDLELSFLDTSDTAILHKKVTFHATKTFKSTGQVDKILNERLKTNFKGDEVTKFKEAQRIKIISNLKSVGDQPVKIFKKNNIMINIGIDAKINYEVKKTKNE